MTGNPPKNFTGGALFLGQRRAVAAFAPFGVSVAAVPDDEDEDDDDDDDDGDDDDGDDD